MKFRYCPQCAAVDLKRLASGMEECPRCHFVGTGREGAMNEINAYKKDLDLGRRSPVSTPEAKTSDPPNPVLQKKMNALKGKKTGDFEIW